MYLSQEGENISGTQILEETGVQHPLTLHANTREISGTAMKKKDDMTGVGLGKKQKNGVVPSMIKPGKEEKKHKQTV